MDHDPRFHENLEDDIRRSVRSATAGIAESISSALKDLGLDEDAESAEDAMLEQQFEVSGDCELSVRCVAGTVEIRTGEESVINVRATKHGSRRRLENTRVDVRRENNRVIAEARPAQGWGWNIGKTTCRADFDIEVPRGCKVEVKTVSADVSIAGTNASFDVDTVSGEVVIQDASGDCTMRSVSGDMSVRRLDGTLVARATSGDLSVRESRLDRFFLNSVSGDFLVQTPLKRDEHYIAKTISGDLELQFPLDTGATIQLKTISGDIRCDVPAEIMRSGRRNWQGRINGGGAIVEVLSASGDVRIARFGAATETDQEPPAAPPQATEPPPAPSREDTTAILRDLENGEITVEDAMRKLEALQ